MPGLWRVKRVARKLASRLLASVVDVPVEPIVCLTRAYPSPATTILGVRVVSIDQLVSDISGRRKILEPSRAQKAAQKLSSVG